MDLDPGRDTKHRHVQANRLVHVSGGAVTTGKEDEINPLGVYGKSKALGEKAVRAVLPHAHCIIRTQWLYGRQGRNFVETVIQRGRETGSLRVVNDQTGSPTYTKDLARGIIALLWHNAAGIVHVTNSGWCTWYEFASVILEYADLTHVSVVPITTEELQRPAPRPKFSVLDTTKFSVLTGQKIQHWKQGLQEYFNDRSNL